jgi:hypothetical protein
MKSVKKAVTKSEPAAAAAALSPEDISFTRYLYIKQRVFYSLGYCILKKQVHESLFWAYELFYSGFQEELLSYLNRFREDHFQSKPAGFSRFWNKMQSEYGSNDSVLATLIVNLIRNNKTPRGKNLYIVYSMDNIEEFKTIEASDDIRPYRVLNTKCIYNSCKPALNELGPPATYNIAELTNIWRNKWLYYSYNTPIWKDRIDRYMIILNHKDSCLTFKNDDDAESFYNIYGYEPDEQPLSVFQNVIG